MLSIKLEFQKFKRTIPLFSIKGHNVKPFTFLLLNSETIVHSI